MVGKIGPQPTYAKCLIIAGDSLQGLNLLENYFVWAFQQLDFLNTPNEVILHNATKYDLQDWISETALPKLTVGTAVLLRPSLDSPYAARLPQDFLDFENAGEGRLPVGPFRADVASPWPLQ